MNENRYYPEKVFVEKGSINSPLTKKIHKKLGQIPIKIVGNIQEAMEEIEISRDPIKKGKKALLITCQKGSFIKPCPCTPYYVCCNYFIINSDVNCPLDCSYCILQQYLKNPLITIHSNTNDLWSQLDIFLRNNKGRGLRIGTGELGDSLVLDHLTERSKDLISFFRKRGNAQLELKTKTVNIKNILESEPADNIVIAWSLNSEKMAREEEHGAPPVWERIEAAKLVSGKGFRVAFHFDPIIRYQGWEEEYGQIIDILLKASNTMNIAWISLGSLRFPPDLKAIIKKRFPSSLIIYDEFVKGKDGKFRYFKPVRVQLYKKLVSLLKQKEDQSIPLYFCMENNEVWKEIIGKKPRSKEDVEEYLASRLG